MRCVSGLLAPLVSTYRMAESPSVTPCTSIGLESALNCTLNPVSAMPRESRTSDVAVARWSVPPTGRSAAKASLRMNPLPVVSMAELAKPTCTPFCSTT